MIISTELSVLVLILFNQNLFSLMLAASLPGSTNPLLSKLKGGMILWRERPL